MKIRNYEFPDDLYYWLPDDMWCRRESNDVLVVGISSFGLHLSGDIFMCRPKQTGSHVQQGQTMGVVELSKSVVTIKSPATGEIIDVNPRLASEPEIIQRDPYGSGWLARLRPSRWDQDCAALVSGEALPEKMHARIVLEPEQ